MHIRNARKVTIYKDPKCYNSQVGAVQLSNGEVVVVFNECRGRRHDDSDNVVLVRSMDNGATWDPATRVVVYQYTHQFGTDTPSIQQLSGGTLIVNFVMTAHAFNRGITEDFGPQSDRYRYVRSKDGAWLTRSNDLGKTWEPAYKANIAPLRWGQPIDEVLELPSGNLLMACWGKMTSRELETHETVRSFLIRSDDKGVDWEHLATIAYDPANIISFWEPSITRTPDGTILCMIRTVHEPRWRHDNLWLSYSKDDGYSWSRPERTPLWGYPPDLTVLQDGRILCTYGYRRAPWGVRACVSDDGIHWDIANEFVIQEGGVAPEHAQCSPKWHIGYPTSIQLRDGTIFSVYHEWTQEEPYVQYVVGMLYELED